MAARTKTPEPSGLSEEDSQRLMEGTRLGRVLGPIIKAIGKVSAGEAVSNEELALETLANRIKLLSDEAQLEEVDHPHRASLREELRDAEAILEDEDDLVSEAPSVARSVKEEIEAVVREQLAEQYTPDTTSQRVLVEPPVLFSKEEVLKGRDRIDELKLNFSCMSAKGKFSGSKDYLKRGELDVISFLESLTRGQQVMGLTEPEFLRTMILSSTGTPQELLMGYIKDNERGEMTVAAIYLSFTDSFFYELRPEQALGKLHQLTAARHPFVCLSEAENQIKQWAKLASLEHKDAKKRATMADWYFKDYYLKVIPDKFSSAMIQSIDRLEGIRKREVTSNELIAMTRGFRFEIDSIFYKKNHHSQGNGKTGNNGGANSAKVKKGKAKQAKASGQGKIQVMTRQQTKAANNGNGPPKPKPPGNNAGTNPPKSPGYKGSAPGKPPNPGGGAGQNGGKNRFQQKPPKSQTPLLTSTCRLCGQSTHVFSDCQLFKEHERIVGQNMCPCPLQGYHLPKFCPVTKN